MIFALWLVAAAAARDHDIEVSGVLFGKPFTGVAAYGGPPSAADPTRRPIAIADHKGSCDGSRSVRRFRAVLASIELEQDGVLSVTEPATDVDHALLFAYQAPGDVHFLVGTATLTVMPTSLTPGTLQIDVSGPDPAVDHLSGAIRFTLCPIDP